MKQLCLLYFFTFSLLALAHEGHNHEKRPVEQFAEQSATTVQVGRPTSWSQWVGSFHLIFLHFPIALINMLAVSEAILAFSNRLIFEFSSRFLIVSASILTPLTALFGIIYSYSAKYAGIMETFLWWHLWSGILTAIATVALVLFRKCLGKSKLYFAGLILLLLLVNLTSFFGGGMTFGPYQWMPPL